MSCFGNRVSTDLYQNCCNANTLCEFSGRLEDVVAEPLFVQKVYDAVLFNLQGMKTVQNQVFEPRLPRDHRVKRVIDIRCRRFFNPENVDDKRNLKLDVNTTISGATFLQNANGEQLRRVPVPCTVGVLPQPFNAVDYNARKFRAEIVYSYFCASVFHFVQHFFVPSFTVGKSRVSRDDCILRILL